jgi:hypothetical protein
MSSVDASWLVGEVLVLDLRVNSATFARNKAEVEASVTKEIMVQVQSSYYFTAGQQVDVFVDHTRSGDITSRANSSEVYFNIEKIQGPQQIAASGTVGCRYTTNAGQTLTSGAFPTLVFEDRDYDSHGSMNTSTGIYTVPVSGIYLVTSKIVMGVPVVSWTSGELSLLYIYLNNTAKGWDGIQHNTTHSNLTYINITIPVRALAGETIDIRSFQNSGGNCSLSTNTQENEVSITRVGNY